jgi:hypothetical protein
VLLAHVCDVAVDRIGWRLNRAFGGDHNSCHAALLSRQAKRRSHEHNRAHSSAAERVERWLAERGDLDGLRGRIDVGDEDVARRLAELLIDPS